MAEPAQLAQLKTYIPFNTMKILLVLTGHRQLEEYSLFAKILKQSCPRLCAETDLFIHCNHAEISEEIQTYFKEFPQKNKRLYITTKNCGYRAGGFEAVSDLYEMNIFQGYDLVIHLHPDVFITREDALWKYIDSMPSMPQSAFYGTTCLPHIGNHLAFDFFMFRPSGIQQNIFNCWKTMGDTYPEHMLFQQIMTHTVPALLVPRYSNNDHSPRRIDEHLGLWHEHDLEKVRKYLEQLITTAPTTSLTSASF